MFSHISWNVKLKDLLSSPVTWVFFGALFILVLLLPISYVDDLASTVNDPSAFHRQFHDYFVWHGRFLTHYLGRLVLSNRYLADILTALVAMIFLLLSAVIVDPDNDGFKAHTVYLWGALILFLPLGVWIPMIQVIHFFSYRLSLIFMLIFLLPYIRLIKQENYQQSSWIVLLLGFLAGQTHEQAVILTPALLIVVGLFYYQKRNIPSWFWVGIIGVILGNCIVMGSPYGRSVERLIEYGGALNWNFYGQTLNWLELGHIRYIYSLVKVVHMWIPHAIIPTIIFIILWIKVFKVRGFSQDLQIALLLFILANAAVAVMMFSPRHTNSAFVIAKDFLIIALFYLFRIYGLTTNKSKEWGKKFLPIAYVVIFIPLLVQMPAVIAYRIEHWNFVQKLSEARKNNQSTITVRYFERHGLDTPFGRLRFVYPPRDMQLIAKYQGYKDITVIIEK